MVAYILPTDTPSTQGVGSKGQTISISESSHVAYQIKADDSGSNMVANIFPTDTLSTQGVGSKGQTIYFSESSHVTPGCVAQSVTCLATDACLTADPGVTSSIPAWYHTFVEIDHEIISTVILLPSADLFKKGCCQLQAKVCAQITG